MITLDPDACWAAVIARDKSFDGRFYYAVKRPGVYCRPSCPSRRPNRENVSFFATPDDAEAAGFRACLRCRPRAVAGTDPAAEVVTAMARHIEANADEPLPLTALAKRAGYSPWHFQRAFTAVMGVSPKAYQAAARMRRLKTALREGDSVAGAIFEAGFGSTSRAYARTDGHIGMTPAVYRAGGAGETLHWACRQTAYGTILMAATARGVAFVEFGDGEAALLDQLNAEFPRAALAPAPQSSELDAWIDALGRHLDAGAPRPDLPLDLRGTAFQVKVWRFLLSVPAGDVVSYAEVAKGIGEPRAVRAAASACGANKVAVLIPCHRVLRGDGGIGGYRWGVERKRALLAGERRA
jgi:AraC family transcriptional regulator, regulatory protein of adaptative response / methylated-DNA-[protein]-cysteine methyltransferase